MVVAHSWCVNSRIARVRLAAESIALKTRVALLEEQMRIKDARMCRIPAESRPHYPPTERLAILSVKAAQGWNNAQAARAFLVTSETIARWLCRLDAKGEDALVALPTPVNRFPDFVALLVQQLKSTCPLLGKQRIAETLARAGLHLSASTVGRMRKKKLASPIPPGDTKPGAGCSSRSTTEANCAEAARDKSQRIVTARYPNHVWHIDLTAVPTCIGFWVPWFPYSWTEHWPFCFWVFVIIDQFSRKAILLRAFRGTPSATEVTNALDLAIAMVGIAPKHIISDQGSQFRQDYKDWCELRGIKPRFGAIGQHGSIAVVERFIRTLKTECTRRIIIPLGCEAFLSELIAYANWYNEYRPHQSRRGATPNEIYDRRLAARDGPRIEVRPNFKTRDPGMCSVEPTPAKVPRLGLVVKHLEGRKHLPVVKLERAA